MYDTGISIHLGTMKCKELYESLDIIIYLFIFSMTMIVYLLALSMRGIVSAES